METDESMRCPKCKNISCGLVVKKPEHDGTKLFQKDKVCKRCKKLYSQKVRE